MKRICVTLVVLLAVLTAGAQQLPRSFFDAKGNLRMETQELEDNADTLVSIFHRADDIVWSRVIYRVIDMRYKQNFQLYYPIHTNHERYHNLLNVIADAVIDGMPIYSTEFNLDNQRINPDYSDKAQISKLDIPEAFRNFSYYESTYVDDDDAMAAFYDRTRSPAMLIWCSDTTSGDQTTLIPNYTNFNTLVRNQLKYLIQEVIFFDKHTSRLCSKIIGIAPLYADKNLQRGVAEPENNEQYRQAFLSSIMFWVVFDDLRPYLAKQYLIPTSNESKRVTYEEFFQKRLYSSYIVAISDMYDRMILDYTIDPDEIAKEQDKIATSLLTFEQDLWEY